MNDLQEVLDTTCDDSENALFATSEDEEEQTEGVEPGKKRSMRAAINLMCRECIYDDQFKGGGTWREQVGACTVTKCALFEFRPHSRPRKNKEE